jgi:Zn-dependent protease with chaperone function
MVNLSNLRHPKEKGYFIFCAIIGGLAWLILLTVTYGGILIGAIFFAVPLWISQQFFKAIVYGNAVKVSEVQYEQINKIVKEKSAELNITKIPDVFIVNGQGVINAVAMRFLTRKYIILLSNLVDLMLKRDEVDELTMVVGHELAHHAAGHISVWKNLLIWPSKIIPFLGSAYGRACELTADRIGMVLTKNIEASKRALISISSGSESLASTVNINAFKDQENQMPMFFGFLQEIYSSHPRMTRRIIELESFEKNIT